MQEYKEFIFTDYDFNNSTGELSLRYSLDNEIDFEEKVFFDLKQIDIEKVDQNLLDKAFFNLHLIAGISYYKTYCPSELRVESGVLSGEQVAFWEKLYTLGLGEFFYKNQIDFRGLVKFSSESKKSPLRGLGGVAAGAVQDSGQARKTIPKKSLVPIGGGKDSLVTAELLKKAGFDFTLYSLGDSVPQAETAELVGKERFIVRRELSPNLFELNKEGVYNGHVPISAYIAFLSIATSILYGYDYIVLSNEHSANYGNLDYLGMNINHQYSKSLEFEQDFNNYVSQNITTEIKYFSLLRPYYELKIAKIFAKHSQYFQKFTSCNANFKLRATSRELRAGSKWCKNCPKCAFVYSILSPFISKDKMIEIFGKNLFDEENLKNLFLELLGVQENKPFECVGTAEEVAVAFYLASQKDEFKNDLMIKIFVQEILPKIKDIEEIKEKVFGTYLKDSLVPDEFHPCLT